MAKDKRSFLLYTDVMHTVTYLTDEQAGQLFKHLLAYVNDEDPVCDNPIINIAFEPIKQTLKRDLKKYEDIKKDRSNAGKLGNLKRYNLDLYKKVICKDMLLDEALTIAKDRTATYSEELKLNGSQKTTNPHKTSQSDTKDINKSTIKEVYLSSNQDVIAKPRKAIQSDTKLAVNDSVSVSDNIYINKKFTSDKFLEVWKEGRLHWDKLPTNISKLKSNEQTLFNKLSQTYSEKEFREAINGLFFQGTLPAVRVRPSWFLENFESMRDCWLNQSKIYENKKSKS